MNTIIIGAALISLLAGASGIYFYTSLAANKGGLFRLWSRQVTTAIQGYPAGAVEVEANTAAAGDFSTKKVLMRLTYHDPAASGPNGAVVDDNDAYIFAQNIGINSKNQLTYGGGPYLDVGPVVTLSRDVANPPANSLLASIDYGGRDSTSSFVNTRYAFINGWVISPTAGQTSGGFSISTMQAGVEDWRMRFAGGAYMQGTSDPGQGKFAAQGILVGDNPGAGTQKLRVRKEDGGNVADFASGNADVWFSIKNTSGSTLVGAQGNVAFYQVPPNGRFEVQQNGGGKADLRADAVQTKSYTVATLPSASGKGAGATIFVTDEVGGAVPAFSDGTNWRRVTDRAVVQ